MNLKLCPKVTGWPQGKTQDKRWVCIGIKKCAAWDYLMRLVHSFSKYVTRVVSPEVPLWVQDGQCPLLRPSLLPMTTLPSGWEGGPGAPICFGELRDMWRWDRPPNHGCGHRKMEVEALANDWPQNRELERRRPRFKVKGKVCWGRQANVGGRDLAGTGQDRKFQRGPSSWALDGGGNAESTELEDGVKNLVQSLNCVQFFGTTQSPNPQTASHQAPLCSSLSQSLLQLLSVELMMPSNHLMLCHTLLLLPSVSPSIRVFSSELTLHVRWPKYPQSAVRIFLNTLIELESVYRRWFEQSKIFCLGHRILGARQRFPAYQSLSCNLMNHTPGWLLDIRLM